MGGGALDAVNNYLFSVWTIDTYGNNNWLLIVLESCSPPLFPLNWVDRRRYSQSGNDQDEMVEIKISRASCYIFSIFMNNLIQWRKSEAGLAKPISDLFQTLMLFWHPGVCWTRSCLKKLLVHKYNLYHINFKLRWRILLLLMNEHNWITLFNKIKGSPAKRKKVM